MAKKDRKLHFKINTPGFLKEVVDNALGENMGILKIPLNILRINLCLVAERGAELNDPVLNKILCDMALFEQSDPYSKEYNIKMIKEVDKKYAEYQKTKLKKQ